MQSQRIMSSRIVGRETGERLDSLQPSEKSNNMNILSTSTVKKPSSKAHQLGQRNSRRQLMKRVRQDDAKCRLNQSDPMGTSIGNSTTRGPPSSHSPLELASKKSSEHVSMTPMSSGTSRQPNDYELCDLIQNRWVDETHHYEPEQACGRVEYKWKLVKKSVDRIVQLTTQMNFRLTEGRGEAMYRIGVHDDGSSEGISDSDLLESLKTLRTMARTLDADMIVSRVSKGSFGKEAEVIIRKAAVAVPDVPNIRLALLGCEGSGKSTLVGVLVRGILDNGAGRARTSVLLHRHELKAGRTSSITIQYLGFRDDGTIVDGSGADDLNPLSSMTGCSSTSSLASTPFSHSQLTPIPHYSFTTSTLPTTAFSPPALGAPTVNPLSSFFSSPTPSTSPLCPTSSSSTSSPSNQMLSWSALASQSSRIVTLIDLAGHFGYMKTTLLGLLGSRPDYGVVVYSPTSTCDPIPTSSSPVGSTTHTLSSSLGGDARGIESYEEKGLSESYLMGTKGQEKNASRINGGDTSISGGSGRGASMTSNIDSTTINQVSDSVIECERDHDTTTNTVDGVKEDRRLAEMALSHIDETARQVALCYEMCLPFFIVVTKMDCIEGGVVETVSTRSTNHDPNTHLDLPIDGSPTPSHVATDPCSDAFDYASALANPHKLSVGDQVRLVLHRAKEQVGHAPPSSHSSSIPTSTGLATTPPFPPLGIGILPRILSESCVPSPPCADNDVCTTTKSYDNDVPLSHPSSSTTTQRTCGPISISPDLPPLSPSNLQRNPSLLAPDRPIATNIIVCSEDNMMSKADGASSDLLPSTSSPPLSSSNTHTNSTTSTSTSTSSVTLSATPSLTPSLQTAITGCRAGNLIPLIPVSLTTGSSLNLLRRFLFHLPKVRDWSLYTNDPPELQIGAVYYKKKAGVVVTGVLSRGCIKTGDELLIGPLPRPKVLRRKYVIGGYTNPSTLSQPHPTLSSTTSLTRKERSHSSSSSSNGTRSRSNSITSHHSEMLSSSSSSSSSSPSPPSVSSGVPRIKSPLIGDMDSVFKRITIKSLHIGKNPVPRAKAGEAIAIALGKQVNRQHVRVGMTLLDTSLSCVCVREFIACVKGFPNLKRNQHNSNSNTILSHSTPNKTETGLSEMLSAIPTSTTSTTPTTSAMSVPSTTSTPDKTDARSSGSFGKGHRSRRNKETHGAGGGHSGSDTLNVIVHIGTIAQSARLELYPPVPQRQSPQHSATAGCQTSSNQSEHRSLRELLRSGEPVRVRAVLLHRAEYIKENSMLIFREPNTIGTGRVESIFVLPYDAQSHTADAYRGIDGSHYGGTRLFSQDAGVPSKDNENDVRGRSKSASSMRKGRPSSDSTPLFVARTVESDVIDGSGGLGIGRIVSVPSSDDDDHGDANGGDDASSQTDVHGDHHEDHASTSCSDDDDDEGDAEEDEDLYYDEGSDEDDNDDDDEDEEEGEDEVEDDFGNDSDSEEKGDVSDSESDASETASSSSVTTSGDDTTSDSATTTSSDSEDSDDIGLFGGGHDERDNMPIVARTTQSGNAKGSKPGSASMEIRETTSPVSDPATQTKLKQPRMWATRLKQTPPTSLTSINDTNNSSSQFNYGTSPPAPLSSTPNLVVGKSADLPHHRIIKPHHRPYTTPTSSPQQTMNSVLTSPSTSRGKQMVELPSSDSDDPSEGDDTSTSTSSSEDADDEDDADDLVGVNREMKRDDLQCNRNDVLNGASNSVMHRRDLTKHQQGGDSMHHDIPSTSPSPSVSLSPSESIEVAPIPQPPSPMFLPTGSALPPYPNE